MTPETLYLCACCFTLHCEAFLVMQSWLPVLHVPAYN